MSGEVQIHYHGTTVDRIDSIHERGTLPMFREDTGLTGVWTTEVFEKSVKHAVERGVERGGIEPVVIKVILPINWVFENDDRESVNKAGYGKEVHCFKSTISKDIPKTFIYPNRIENK